jgi:putative oxidoreductase
VGTIAALIQLWIALSPPQALATHALLAVLSISLALLGPGAWSIDALIFGRKRIDI